jgi:hypothetical protein
MKLGPDISNNVKPEPAPAVNNGSKNVAGNPGACVMASNPPAALIRIGMAIAKPANFTINCTTLTPTELSNPPALK